MHFVCPWPVSGTALGSCFVTFVTVGAAEPLVLGSTRLLRPSGAAASYELSGLKLVPKFYQIGL